MKTVEFDSDRVISCRRYDVPMIVYCCSDLIFATKIRSTADSLQITTRPARTAEALLNRLNRVDDGKANAPVKAVLVDLDLGEVGLELIRITKAHPASPEVVAFGAHVGREMLAEASNCGAEFVMPRGSFTATLPVILQRLNNAGTDE